MDAAEVPFPSQASRVSQNIMNRFLNLYCMVAACLLGLTLSAQPPATPDAPERETRAVADSPAMPPPKPTLLPVKDYQEKVYASLIGQLVGNLYGLGYEFKFIDEPGPERMPYGYTADVLRRVAEMRGGFSDDDTDIEYMYLLQMERHGIEPTYQQLAEAWKHHVRERVWVANRVALTLMHTGLYPPHTGMKRYNDQWFQIDPQLVNEIWAVTAPGMIDYATAKSEWAARITSDGFGVEPTVHYAAMYAAAFLEKDIDQLIARGLEALPTNSRFSGIIRHVQELVAQHPDNWQAARRTLADRYYGEQDYNRGAWAAVDANLNGACGIMALLYGKGDFQRTLDMACALGFDADNQAATMAGLLGIANGLDSIPRELLFPLENAGWEQPFNDTYVNVSRHDLPDARLSDMAQRMARQGELILLARGGARETIEGEDHYRIPTTARFLPPFELNPPPLLFGTLGEALHFDFYTGRPAQSVDWTIEGQLPPGLAFSEGRLDGTPKTVGHGLFRLRATHDQVTRATTVEVLVRGRNLALEADSILFNPDNLDHELELLRDGDRIERTYYSISKEPQPKTDYYGYRWARPQTISAVRFNVGRRQEFGGWFTSMDVQALNAEGTWVSVQNLQIVPNPNLDNNQWLKTSRVDYDLSFAPVTTPAIRLIGSAGGIEPDAANRHLGTRHYTSISELGVYER